MVSSCLNSSLNSRNVIIRLRNNRRKSVTRKYKALVKLTFASVCFLMCIVVVPERPTKLASICEKYNPSVACQVW